MRSFWRWHSQSVGWGCVSESVGGIHQPVPLLYCALRMWVGGVPVQRLSHAVVTFQLPSQPSQPPTRGTFPQTKSEDHHMHYHSEHYIRCGCWLCVRVHAFVVPYHACSHCFLRATTTASVTTGCTAAVSIVHNLKHFMVMPQWRSTPWI